MRASGGIYYAPPGAGTGSGSFQKGSSTGFTTTPSFSSPDGFSPLYNWDTASFPQNFARPPFIDPTFSNGQSAAAISPDYSRPPQILSWTFSIAAGIGAQSRPGSQLHRQPLHAPRHEQPARTWSMRNYLSLGPTLTQSITSSAAAAAGVPNPFPGFENYPTHTVAQALMPYPQFTGVSQNGGRRHRALQLACR